MNFHGRIT